MISMQSDHSRLAPVTSATCDLVFDAKYFMAN